MSRIETQNSLQKSFLFPTFQDAMSWMLRCSYDIVAMDHHPEWKNIYNRVEVVLTTHHVGNLVTEKDHQLAKILDTHYEILVKDA